jgi:UBA-like domain
MPLQVSAFFRATVTARFSGVLNFRAHFVTSFSACWVIMSGLEQLRNIVGGGPSDRALKQLLTNAGNNVERAINFFFESGAPEPAAAGAATTGKIAKESTVTAKAKPKAAAKPKPASKAAATTKRELTASSSQPSIAKFGFAVKATPATADYSSSRCDTAVWRGCTGAASKQPKLISEQWLQGYAFRSCRRVEVDRT